MSRSSSAHVTWQGLAKPDVEYAGTDLGVSGFRESRQARRECSELEKVHTDRPGCLEQT